MVSRSKAVSVNLASLSATLDRVNPCMPQRRASREPDSPSDKTWIETDRKALVRFQQRMLAWFAEHARDLPWRRSRDLYRIWISEVMLQQTQVATVIDYFQRFLVEFPTVVHLAEADEQQVLRQWEGLGYYRRARSLHAAAKKIVRDFRGQFPETLDEVMSLPGIGRYTAGAILSIGLDAKLPILEANTIRVYARLAGYTREATSTAGQKFLWNIAEQILPDKKVGFFNQAMMELGSALCTPRTPSCDQCPASTWCVARREQSVEQIPLLSKRMVYEDLTEVAVLVVDRQQVLLRQCQPGERWAGLWDFPRFSLEKTMLGAKSTTETDLENYLTERVESLTGIASTIHDQWPSLKHGVTKYRITLRPMVASLREAGSKSSRTKQKLAEHCKWTRIDALDDEPLSVTGRKLAQLLAKYDQTKKLF